MKQEFSKPESRAVQQAAELLGKTFLQRTDIFASQLEDGRYVAVKEALRARHLVLHLQGHITLGAYVLTPLGTARFLVLDADSDSGLSDMANLAAALYTERVPTYLEESRRGGHLWFFLDGHHPGAEVRAFGKAIMEKFDLDGIELFPKQEQLHGGPGSLVRLPFGRHKLTGARYPFITPGGELLAPSIHQQILALSAPRTVPEDVFEAIRSTYTSGRKKRSFRPFETQAASTTVERLKESIPLVEFLEEFVELRPVASGAVGKCPFHDDQHASFGVNREGNYWHCFAGCGAGSIIDFWMKWNEVDFPTAVRQLGQRYAEGKGA